MNATDTKISHDGQFLLTVNTASGTISRYSIAPGGATPAGIIAT